MRVDLLPVAPEQFATLARDISGMPVHMDAEKLKAAIWPPPNGPFRVWIELVSDSASDLRADPTRRVRTHLEPVPFVERDGTVRPADFAGHSS